jgi:hypothetical protein
MSSDNGLLVKNEYRLHFKGQVSSDVHNLHKVDFKSVILGPIRRVAFPNVLDYPNIF